MIYFVQAGEGGPIKIGHTSTGLQARLSGLQIGNPILLTCIGVMDGTVQDEHAVHAQFRAQYRDALCYPSAPTTEAQPCLGPQAVAVRLELVGSRQSRG
jgi:hypothetical protein